MTPLEDKEAIRELFSEYCFRMDDFRFAELVRGVSQVVPRYAGSFGCRQGRQVTQQLMQELAAVPVDPKQVERTAEALGVSEDRRLYLSGWAHAEDPASIAERGVECEVHQHARDDHG